MACEIEFNDSNVRHPLREFSDEAIDRVAKEQGCFGGENYFTIYEDGEETGGGDFHHGNE